ncbi:MAG: hypothetical protein CMH49_08435 [Myxococcales bacterium]|nr:hypothetical protein [Myxococcales bacterium]
MYTMMKRLASDLSPAQLLIGQISCQSCQDFALEAHFYQAIQTIEKQMSLQIWQKKRLFALLSPMYLEVIGCLLSSRNYSGIFGLRRDRELLLEYKLSNLKSFRACTHQAAIQSQDELLRTALLKLKKIFNEVLGEQIF